MRFAERRVVGLAAALLTVALAGCNNGVDAPYPGSVTIYATAEGRVTATPASGAPAAALDSVVVTRARLLVRSFRVTPSGGSYDLSGYPVVLEFTDTAVRSWLRGSVPLTTFSRCTLDLRPFADTELVALPESLQAPFIDFQQQAVATSVIVDGVTAGAGTRVAFRFIAPLAGTLSLGVTPVVTLTSASPSVSLTLAGNVGTWFRASSGALLDPSDAANATTIGANIQRALQLYRDGNHDGIAD